MYHKFRRPKAKSIIGFSLASDLNEVEAMNLHELSCNLYYLQIIEVFSRLSASAIMQKREPQTIVRPFMKWMALVFNY